MEPSLAIVGATGAVGREMLAVLEQRRFPHRELRLLASERSTGTTLRYCNEPHPVRALSAGSLDGVDLALFAAGGSVARDLAPAAAARGTTVIDNSSAFRLAPGVPLVVPEINPGALRSAPLKTPRDWPGIIANPNCSTILLLMALTPLRRAFGLERVVVSTYQAASGAGARGMDELTTQTRTALAGGEPRPSVFHEPYAFNLFSHNTAIDPRTGLNVEEQKIIDETRKIWDDPGLRISATCVRVPTLRAHAESVNLTLARPATTAQVRAALAGFPGVRVLDDRAANSFPTPLKATGCDEVLVGRIRPDPGQMGRQPNARPSASGENSTGAPSGDEVPTRGFDLFLCGDQLRKGAALNAVQIAELLVLGAAGRAPSPS